MKVTSGNMPLCHSRVDDDLVRRLLINRNPGNVTNTTTSRLHVSILMAARVVDTV